MAYALNKFRCICCGSETTNTEKVVEEPIYKCKKCIKQHGKCATCMHYDRHLLMGLFERHPSWGRR